jgi:uncharacterized protein YigA (DUF484 family)
MRGGPLSETAEDFDALRDKILSEPDLILDDPDVMRALIEANERALGSNIVDLRGIAMERLEARLDRLEDAHRSVIAAAYDNLAGTNQIHRAVLRLLEPTEFEAFLRDIEGDLSDILRVDAARLVLESDQDENEPALQRLGRVLTVAEPGFIDDYLTRGRNVPVRQVTLRQIRDGEGGLYEQDGGWLRSEACLRLDFGAGRMQGLLALGAEDPHQFTPAHGTDLLTFFAGVFERAMRRWLA